MRSPDQLARIAPEHYALGEEIARGGMGRIFRARDLRLGRDVAIKESVNHDARLEREARIAGRLRHPSIIQIHEAGVWPTGEPFFAMPLISGRSLDEAIDEAKTLDDRLALVPNVLAVADAIAHAHSRNVIHRDLKPRNVIVGAFGETVVIDWGLAKDLSDTEPEESDAASASPAAAGHTEVGAVIGTPAYMPPEQARGEVVDRRADVYALGAILYRVLSGNAPVSGTATLELEIVASGGVAPLERVQPNVPADLLAIVAKAMAYEPRDRYVDARELAQDLRKYVTGQLVGARHYAWHQLVARWLRRHRIVVAIAAVAIVALAVIGGVSLRRIFVAKSTAEANRAEAKQSRGDAEEMLRFMIGELHEKLQPLGKTDALDDVAKKASDYYRRRGNTSSLDERHNIGVAINNLGDVLFDEGHSSDALAQYTAAYAIAATLFVLEPGDPAEAQALETSHERIGDVLLVQGDHAGALAHFRVQLALSEQLAASQPDDLRLRRNLDVAHNKLADVLIEMGRAPEAIAEYRAALVISERLATVAPSAGANRDLALDHASLGVALANHGEREESVVQQRASLTVLERAAALEPDDAQTQQTVLATHMLLGQTLGEGDDHAGAAAEFRAALAIGEPLSALDPTNAGLQSNVATCRTGLASAEHGLGHDAVALDELNKALPVQVALAAQDPAQLDRQRDVEVSHRELSQILFSRGDRAAALRELATALEIATQLAGKDPNSSEYQADLGGVHAKLGEAHFAAGDRATAAKELRVALALHETAAARDPSNRDNTALVAHTHAELGDAIQASDIAGALAEYRAALPIYEQAGERDPNHRATADELRKKIAKLAR